MDQQNNQHPQMQHPLEIFKGRSAVFRYRIKADEVIEVRGTIISLGDGMIVVGHKLDTHVRLIPLVSLVDIDCQISNPEAELSNFETIMQNRKPN